MCSCEQKTKIVDTVTNPCDYSFLTRPFPGESVSGDGGCVIDREEKILFALWDVAGHGEDAHSLSRQVDGYLQECRLESPAELIQQLHETFRGGRGMVAVIALLEPLSGIVRYAGVGNIFFLQFQAGRKLTKVLQEGIIGYQIRTPVQQCLQLQRGDTLVMHSDGLRVKEHPGFIESKMPVEQISRLLLQKYRDGNDDASCLVMRWCST